MASGNYVAACTKLEGSQSLDPGPGTEYNLALCYEKSGRTASAWATYLSAAASYKATNRADWETRARDHASALAGNLSKVTIVAPAPAPPGLRITRDGAAVLTPEMGVPIPLDPGRHVVDAVADGRPKFSAGFDLAPGASRTVTVVLAGPAAAASGEGDPGAGRRAGAYALGAAGVVGVGLGAISGLVAMNKNAASTADCPQDGRCKSPSAIAQNESASNWAAVSTVSFIAAGALLAAGALVFFTAPTATRASIATRVGLGSAGVVGAW